MNKKNITRTWGTTLAASALIGFLAPYEAAAQPTRAHNATETNLKNTTYVFPSCTKEGAPKKIPLKNGLYTKGKMPGGIEVSFDKAFIGTMGTTPVQVVALSCQVGGANYSIPGWFVYSTKGHYLDRIETATLEETYKKQFNADPVLYLSNALNAGQGEPTSLQNNALVIKTMANGIHADPDDILTYRFTLDKNNRVVLAGPIEKMSLRKKPMP